MSMAEKAFVDPVIRSHVNPLRRELGLAPARRIFSRQIHGARVAYAFPEWFAPAASDWPAQGRFAGFILQPQEDGPIDAALRPFLASGKPLAVVTAGTAVARRPGWVECAALAAAERGCKVLIVSPDLTPSSCPDAMVVRYAPFQALLRHARVFVHHGGIGTIAEAMRAGVVQIVVPSAHDQPDNAARLERLGIGVTVSDNAGPAAFHEALAACVDHAAMRDAVKQAQASITTEGDASERIADMVLA